MKQEKKESKVEIKKDIDEASCSDGEGVEDNKSEKSKESLEDLKAEHVADEEDHEEIVENQQDWLTGCPKLED